MTKTKTYFPQVPVEVVKKIAKEENGEQIDRETPERAAAAWKAGTGVEREKRSSGRCRRR